MAKGSTESDENARDVARVVTEEKPAERDGDGDEPGCFRGGSGFDPAEFCDFLYCALLSLLVFDTLLVDFFLLHCGGGHFCNARVDSCDEDSSDAGTRAVVSVLSMESVLRYWSQHRDPRGLISSTWF